MMRGVFILVLMLIETKFYFNNLKSLSLTSSSAFRLGSSSMFEQRK